MAELPGGPSLTLPFQEETYSVSALCQEVRDLLQQAYAAVWVAGEVNRVRESRGGHLYFELIEKGEGDAIVGKLEAVAWRSDLQRIRVLLADSGQEIAEGQQIRCRGTIDFYPPFGRLQLVVREVDPVFTLGLMARRRQETLTALTVAGLLERNRRLPLSAVPLRIGLVTSEGSAAYHDFLSSLRESGYGFRVEFVHAAVQGREAERQVASALQLLSRPELDCVVVVRGGGSRADLAVFDSRLIAEVIAHSAVPVLTGLGHEIDQSIADLTAHTALKTPTKAAEFLVQRVAGAERRLVDLRHAMAQTALVKLREGRQALGRAERGLSLARYRLVSARGQLRHVAQALPSAARRCLRHHALRLEQLQRRLAAASPRQVERNRQRSVLLVERIAGRSEARLRELTVRLQGWERLCLQLAPGRTLERGFSITRDAAGRVLSDPGQVGLGEQIVSQLARGRLLSRVEEP